MHRALAILLSLAVTMMISISIITPLTTAVNTEAGQIAFTNMNPATPPLAEASNLKQRDPIRIIGHEGLIYDNGYRIYQYDHYPLANLVNTVPITTTPVTTNTMTTTSSTTTTSTTTTTKTTTTSTTTTTMVTTTTSPRTITPTTTLTQPITTTTPSVPQKGSIVIRVHNIEGLKMPQSGGYINIIVLYFGPRDELNKTISTISYKGNDDYVEAVFSNIELNRYYTFLVEHIPSTWAGLKEFWGSGTFILTPGNSSAIIDFYRNGPYIYNVSYPVSTELGEPITFKITVKGGTGESYRITVILDRDLKPPYDVTQTSDEFSLNPGETKTIDITLKPPPERGKYTPYIILSYHALEPIYDQWDGSWKPIEIGRIDLDVSFSSKYIEYEKPYTLEFFISINRGTPGKYIENLNIISPNGKVITISSVLREYDGGKKEFTLSWTPPKDSDIVPGTYVALLSYTKNGTLVISRATAFYLNDPDKSYIEVFDAGEGKKIIHIHLQRWRIETHPLKDEISARTILLKAVSGDAIGVVRKGLNFLYEKYESVLKGVSTPTKPYDVTIMVFPAEVSGTFFGLLFETHPLKAPYELIRGTMTDLIIKALTKSMSIDLISSVPIPLEYFVLIPKEVYDSFQIGGYTFLHFPTEVVVKADYPSSIKLGQTLRLKVEFTSFLGASEPLCLEEGDIYLLIKPEHFSTTPSYLTSFHINRCLKRGETYEFEIPPEVLETILNAYHDTSYVMYFFVVAPGYIGLSKSLPISISGKSFCDIRNLKFSVSPLHITLSDTVTIKTSFDVIKYITSGSMSVKVEVLKKSPLGFVTVIDKRDASIGHNDIIINIRGDQIVDKIMGWPILGTYKIRLKVIASYVPYGTTSVETLEVSTDYVKIDIEKSASVTTPANVEETSLEIFNNFSALLIHSPVDVTISSSDGGILVVVNGTVARNDFTDSYVYISDEYKIFLLPLNRSYSIELTATDRGYVTIETVYTLGENLTINTFRNIMVDKGSKIYLPAIQSEKADIDTDGDGRKDIEIKAEVFSKAMSVKEIHSTTPTMTSEHKGGATSLLSNALVIGIIVFISVIAILLFALLARKRN